MAGKMLVILLDTCGVPWLTINQGGLSDRGKRSPLEHAGNLSVSAVSAFEIGKKAVLGKLKLKLKPAVWFPRACELRG